ncbi:MAG: hypothetical protein IJL99_04860 [Firmicutes bacterium]|nr:hypothetical protein [Bacillota bacterium]
MNRVWRNNWVKAIAINLVILVVAFLLADTVYETNDDYVISLRMVDGYPFSTFVNWFLCKIVIGLQSLMPGINAFVVLQIAISWVCFVLITRTILESFESKTLLVIAILLLTVFAGDHYCIMQFTKTSALALTTGFLLLMDAMVRKRGAGIYVVSFILIYLGTWMRDMNLVAAIGFAGIFLIAWVLGHRKELIPGGYLKGRRLALYGVCLLLIAGAAGTYAWSVSINSATPELEQFNEYDKYRTNITDYPIYENYDAAADEYEAAGISKNDMYLTSHWYIDYDGAASPEKLKEITAIYNEKAKTDVSFSEAVNSCIDGVREDMSNFTRRGMHLIILWLLLLIGILLYRPRVWIYIIAIGALAAALYVYLYYVGRPLYRASYIADVSAIIWILYYMGGEEVRKGLQKPDAKGVRGIKIMMCVICAAFVLLCQMPIMDSYTQLHNHALKGKMSEQMEAFLDENDDNFYVFANGTRGLSPYYSDPLTMPEPNYQKNALGFGSWGTKSPYIMDKLARYDLNNTFGDLIDNPKAFVFEDKNIDKLMTYFNKWYGGDGEIVFEHVDEIAGHDLWSVKRLQ